MYTHNTLNMISDATKRERLTPLGVVPRLDTATALGFIHCLREIHALPTAPSAPRMWHGDNA